jgi:hypothetical protein
METFKAGDLVTYRLHGDDYGIAQVLGLEQMTSYAHIHLKIFDAVLEGEQGGADSYGVLYQRSLTMPEDEKRLATAVDHIALSLDAFAESTPAKIDHLDLTDDDMKGYQLWILGARQELQRRGLIHADDAESDEEEYDEEEYEEEEYIEGDEMNVPGDLDESDIPESIEEELDHLEREEGEQSLYNELLPEGGTLELRPWHLHIFDRSLAEVLFELRDSIARDAESAPRLSAYITAFFASKGEAINELVERFVNEGDYAAGHELMAFGDTAAEMLAQHLQDGMDPQVAEDITNILCDMGSLRAYEEIVRFYLQHDANADDPLNYPAARAFCYAVMLTGGTPEPLSANLSRLDDVTNPELAHDVAAAREAIRNVAQGTPPSDVQRGASTDPFAALNS